jgi:hypothetical protein
MFLHKKCSELVYTSIGSPWIYVIIFYLSDAWNSCMFIFHWFYSCVAIKNCIFINLCWFSILSWITLLTFVNSWEASCGSACLVHCLERFGSGDAVDVLATGSCASPCGYRPGWPSASTNSTLGACNGGEFTAMVAAVASSSTPWLRWVSISPSLIYVLYDSIATSFDLGLSCVILW